MLGLERWRPTTRQMTRPGTGLSTVDDLFSSFFDEPFFEGFGAQTWSPSSDVVETDDHIKIYLDLPGMKREHLDIQLADGNTLVVRGERKFEEQDKTKYHRLERFYGNFTRTFVLPSSVDAEKIDASFKDGVLEVVLPKAESAKARRIQIHS